MKYLVLVGGFGSSIECFELDINENDVKESCVTFQESCSVDEKPAFLDAVDEKVYCVHEVSSFKGEKTGGLSFLKVGGEKLYKIQSQFSSGEGPCHIVINPSYNCAYITNYESGHFAVAKVKKEGLLGGGLYIESYDDGSAVNPTCQEQSHPHGTCYRGKYVYVTDLGSDKIWHYQHGSGTEFNSGNPVFTDTPPGSGPRHMVFHPTYNISYVITELSNELLVYKFHEGNGMLEKLDSYKYLSDHQKGENYGAEIAVHPSGKFVYLSNRGNGSLVSYHVTDNGSKLEKIECFETLGTWPRHFGVDPSGKILICADQFKDLIEVMTIDETTGKLERIQNVDCKNQPACVIFINYIE